MSLRRRTVAWGLGLVVAFAAAVGSSVPESRTLRPGDATVAVDPVAPPAGTPGRARVRVPVVRGFPDEAPMERAVVARDRYTQAGPGVHDEEQPVAAPVPAAGNDTVPGVARGRGPGVPRPAVLERCRERYVIAPGVEEVVRPRVPEQFELRRNSAGQPLLYITAIRCERYTALGVARETTAAAFGVSIESPDGTMCATPWPVAGTVAPHAAGSCNNYLLFAAYDHPGVVAWARAGTPDAPVHLVRDLSFVEGGFDPAHLGVAHHFASGGTPSGYVLDLVVRERAATLPLSAAFWFESRAGTVRIGFDTDAIAMGEATGQLTAEEGSEMAAMLGTTTPRAQQPFPLLAGNRWERGTLTKTIHPGLPR